jgi:hypothetical protein
MPWSLTAAALGSFAIIATALQPRLRVCGVPFMRWLILGQFLLVALLWLFYDRYLLPMVPFATALLLAGHVKLRLRVAVVALALFGVISAVGLRDHLSYNRALWDAVAWLRESGAQVSEIDGGYVVNGWLQYAHPWNAPRDEAGAVVVPGMTTKSVALRYVIANAPMPSRRPLREFPYQRWFGRPGKIYVLE